MLDRFESYVARDDLTHVVRWIDLPTRALLVLACDSRINAGPKLRTHVDSVTCLACIAAPKRID